MMIEPTKETVTLHMSDGLAAESSIFAEVMDRYREHAMHPERHYLGPSGWVDEVEHARIGDIRIITPTRYFSQPARPVAVVCIGTGYECDPGELTADECRTEAAKLLAAADVLDGIR